MAEICSSGNESSTDCVSTDDRECYQSVETVDNPPRRKRRPKYSRSRRIGTRRKQGMQGSRKTCCKVQDQAEEDVGTSDHVVAKGENIWTPAAGPSGYSSVGVIQHQPEDLLSVATAKASQSEHHPSSIFAATKAVRKKYRKRKGLVSMPEKGLRRKSKQRDTQAPADITEEINSGLAAHTVCASPQMSVADVYDAAVVEAIYSEADCDESEIRNVSPDDEVCDEIAVQEDVTRRDNTSINISIMSEVVKEEKTSDIGGETTFSVGVRPCSPPMDLCLTDFPSVTEAIGELHYNLTLLMSETPWIVEKSESIVELSLHGPLPNVTVQRSISWSGCAAKIYIHNKPLSLDSFVWETELSDSSGSISHISDYLVRLASLVSSANICKGISKFEKFWKTRAEMGKGKVEESQHEGLDCFRSSNCTLLLTEKDKCHSCKQEETYFRKKEWQQNHPKEESQSKDKSKINNILLSREALLEKVSRLQKKIKRKKGKLKKSFVKDSA